MPRKRRTAPADPLRELVWEEIAGEIAPPLAGPVLCLGDDFAGFLGRRIDASLARERGPAGRRYARIFGWRVLESRGGSKLVETIHRALQAGGEAVLFGYCRFPGREDLAAWEKKCRERDVAVPPRRIPAGALSLSRIAALLAPGPFERYSMRKKGIRYIVNLHR